MHSVKKQKINFKLFIIKIILGIDKTEREIMSFIYDDVQCFTEIERN